MLNKQLRHWLLEQLLDAPGEAEALPLLYLCIVKIASHPAEVISKKSLLDRVLTFE